MAWETINGRRYFYETTVIDGQRIRHCWGNGPEAEQAAARVKQAKQKRAQELERLRSQRLKDQQIDDLVAAFNADIKTFIDQHLHRAGLRYTCGQWRKLRKK